MNVYLCSATRLLTVVWIMRGILTDALGLAALTGAVGHIIAGRPDEGWSMMSSP